MNKKLLLLLLGTTMAWGTMQAGHISPEQALHRVKSESRVKAFMGQLSSPTYSSTIGNLYVFNSGEGYMILPADDRAPALLGYSDSGKFPEKVNPELAYWLDFYNRELNYLESTTSVTPGKVKESRPQRAAIAPLTRTLWNQGDPYNGKCPELNGQRCVTGCVATAMAQVLKYHNYPEKGIGTHSYQWEEGDKELSFDYGATSFDWDSMTDSYNDNSTQQEKDAVATLMLACGISVDMMYSPNESGAYSTLMGTALINYFGYDKGIWLPERDFYGLYEWEDMIYADLEKGLPVLYRGQGTSGGHQFICDGYSSDGYFHFNWGWGGMSDGYFLLTALNPSNLGIGGGGGGFNSYQRATLGVEPEKADSKPHYIMYCPGSPLPVSDSVNAGDSFGMKFEDEEGIYNYSLFPMPADSKLGMKITATDGSYDQFVEGRSFGEELRVGYGFTKYYIVFPDLADGAYTISPAYYANEEWKEAPVQISKIGFINAVVSDGTATFSVPSAPTVSVSEISSPSNIYIGREFPLTFSVKNESSQEYIGRITPILIDANYDMAAVSTYLPLDIMGGATVNYSDYIGKFNLVKDYSFSPGEYYLLFLDESGKIVSDAEAVTVSNPPATTTIDVTGFSLISPDPVADKSNVKFDLTLSCTEGYYAGVATVAIFPEGQTSTNILGYSPIVYLNGGESKNLTVTLDLSNLEAGKYFAIPYVNGKQSQYYIEFSILNVATGVENIETESVLEQSEIYNLQGQKCTPPLLPGIYVINGKKTLVK